MLGCLSNFFSTSCSALESLWKMWAIGLLQSQVDTFQSTKILSNRLTCRRSAHLSSTYVHTHENYRSQSFATVTLSLRKLSTTSRRLEKTPVDKKKMRRPTCIHKRTTFDGLKRTEWNFHYVAEILLI